MRWVWGTKHKHAVGRHACARGSGPNEGANIRAWDKEHGDTHLRLRRQRGRWSGVGVRGIGIVACTSACACATMVGKGGAGRVHARGVIRLGTAR